MYKKINYNFFFKRNKLQLLIHIYTLVIINKNWMIVEWSVIFNSEKYKYYDNFVYYFYMKIKNIYLIKNGATPVEPRSDLKTLNP